MATELSAPRALPRATDLYWLPDTAEAALAGLGADASWEAYQRAAATRLDLAQTLKLDRRLRKRFSAAPEGLATRLVRLALLGSSTLGHLAPAIRVGGVRRGQWIETYEGEYGGYRAELTDPGSGLRRFDADAALIAFDARHVTRAIHAGLDEAAAANALDEALGEVLATWKLARDAGLAVLHQTAPPVFAPLMGSAEHKLPGSKARFLAVYNKRLRELADGHGVHMLALDAWAARQGLGAWCDPLLWLRAKQEVTPLASPLYGDQVARVLAALQGRSSKCLVLDLDNTLWGGVVGDDGVEGIAIGQGSALGEAHLSLQALALELSRRGIILAVCSKNDEANAKAPFERHPDMLLKLDDIACFVANWDDKAKNLRRIAATLNIGLDSLVFVDDNPFERNLVRAELPMVATPELADDPALYADTIADAGYFESVGVTSEDRERSHQYQQNAVRAAMQADAADLPAYLRSLAMTLKWGRFDALSAPRVTQLVNKTNQFNLTTRRYTAEEIEAAMRDPDTLGLHLRLEDRFGDNGLIAVVIGRREGETMRIETWLMSCRVLGRGVEAATLAVLAREAAAMGARRLVGEYLPTAKNSMVADLYPRLGFAALSREDSGHTLWALDLPLAAVEAPPMTFVPEL